MTDTEINLLKLMLMGEITGEYGNRVFKNGVNYITNDRHKFIIFTDELGKEHTICYGITNKK